MNERPYVEPLMSPDASVFPGAVVAEDWAGRWNDAYQEEEMSIGGDGLSLLMAGDSQLFQSDDGLEYYPSDPLREVDHRAQSWPHGDLASPAETVGYGGDSQTEGDAYGYSDMDRPVYDHYGDDGQRYDEQDSLRVSGDAFLNDEDMCQAFEPHYGGWGEEDSDCDGWWAEAAGQSSALEGYPGYIEDGGVAMECAYYDDELESQGGYRALSSPGASRYY